MTSLNPQVKKRRALQYAILAGLVIFTLALCTLVVVMMLRRGPAVAY
jgi:flagellar basal body-associated protein FliL